jgi:hypothetical protein
MYALKEYYLNPYLKVTKNYYGGFEDGNLTI